eukprot:CAMPEP_0194170850 /NCGR_PEP_ID=MMETSP0154-20130528/5492_1 /TAXON_ID=1049557 /ORGANISM="Thalassiothrix antarctica, Strain L6-D1" /LENGTH=319 /DNA_ID=CAMNT_0038882909 /DNA_START=92 /DNA_END=1052 /DNA_ORIENTATION=-
MTSGGSYNILRCYFILNALVLNGRITTGFFVPHSASTKRSGPVERLRSNNHGKFYYYHGEDHDQSSGLGYCYTNAHTSALFMARGASGDHWTAGSNLRPTAFQQETNDYRSQDGSGMSSGSYSAGDRSDYRNSNSGYSSYDRGGGGGSMGNSYGYPSSNGSMILNMVHPEEEKVHTQVALIITAAAEEIMTVEEVTMVLASEDQEIDMVMEIHGNMVVVVENSTIEGTMKTDLTTIIIWMIEDITMVAEVILAKAECMEVIYPNVVVDVVVIDSLDLGSILEQEEKKMIINAMKEEWEGVINVVNHLPRELLLRHYHVI